MSHMRYDMDSVHKQQPHNAMIKHKQVLANLVDYRLTEFKEIDSPISAL